MPDSLHNLLLRLMALPREGVHQVGAGASVELGSVVGGLPGLADGVAVQASAADGSEQRLSASGVEGESTEAAHQPRYGAGVVPSRFELSDESAPFPPDESDSESRRIGRSVEEVSTGGAGLDSLPSAPSVTSAAEESLLPLASDSELPFNSDRLTEGEAAALRWNNWLSELAPRLSQDQGSSSQADVSDSLQIDPPPSDGDFPTGNADLPDSPLATAMATVGGGAFDFTNQGTPQPEAARPSTAALEMEISDAVETQTRTLERLETLLHRLLTTRDHLAHIEERIDQLEAAHQVRSRL